MGAGKEGGHDSEGEEGLEDGGSEHSGEEELEDSGCEGGGSKRARSNQSRGTKRKATVGVSLWHDLPCLPRLG